MMRQIKLFSFVIFILILSCAEKPKAKETSQSFPRSPNPALSAKSFASENGGYGYDIHQDNKLLVHQPNIPGRSGAMGFATKEQALKVAELVMKKIKGDQMPPTFFIKY